MRKILKKSCIETEISLNNEIVKLRRTNGDIQLDNGETQRQEDADADNGFNSNVGPYETPVRPPHPAPRQILKARKRPAPTEDEDEDELKTPVPAGHKVGPPSKKVKGGTQALRNTGSFSHTNWKYAKNVVENEIDNGSVNWRRTKEDINGATQHKKDMDTDVDSDSNVRPYETPVVLQKKKKPVIKSSESEEHPNSKLRANEKKRNEGQPDNATQVSRSMIDC